MTERSPIPRDLLRNATELTSAQSSSSNSFWDELEIMHSMDLNFPEQTDELHEDSPDTALNSLSHVIHLGDPRQAADSCGCIGGSHMHVAKIHEIHDPKESTRLDIHVPFELTEFGAGPRLYPYASATPLTLAGARFAYRTYGFNLAEAISMSRHHITVHLAECIGRTPVQEALEDIMRQSGCPDLQFEDIPQSGSLTFSQRAMGFRSH